ncbi:MAG: tetratricopeptide repeat protein [Candidatus Omnitrophica bacterium]|nr:tetratricopeptide repeat protein [Candidatus Omnitrophota bacterium]
MHENNRITQQNAFLDNSSTSKRFLTRAKAPWLIAALFSLFLLVSLQVRIAPPDLAFYYSFAHSLLYDADFCFADQYAHFPFAYHETYLSSQGLPANDWPMGAGIAWMPFLGLSRLIQWIGSWMTSMSPPNGMGFFDQWVVTLGATLLYSLGALWLTHQYGLREKLSSKALLWALSLTAVGSSYSYHLFVNSADSHPPSAFFIILFLLTWQSHQSKPRLHSAFAAGLIIGLAGLIRPHNLIFLMTPLIDWLIGDSSKSSFRSFVARFSAMLFAALLTFFPQLLVWKTLYGAWLAIPRAGDVLWTQPELYNTLFSDFHGMISWSPLFGLGLAGLFLKKRWLPIAIPLLFLLYVYSCNIAWWCGGSFGNRRMVSYTPLFIIGLAALFEKIPKLWLKIFAAGCALWTFLLLLAEVGGAIQLDHFQPWGEILHAIQSGWRDGFMQLATGAEWETQAAARILGYFCVIAFLITALILGRYLRNIPKRRLTSLFLALALIFNVFCIAAALRTLPAAQKSDLSGYIDHDRFTWVVYFEKGFYLLGKQDYLDSVENMMAAAVAEPRHPEPWMYIAYVCADVFGWNNLSYHFSHKALIQGKNTTVFLRFFERILSERLQTGASPPELIYNQRGVIRAVLGQSSAAEQDFRQALQLKPDLKAASENLETLEIRRQGVRKPFQWE